MQSPPIFTSFVRSTPLYLAACASQTARTVNTIKPASAKNVTWRACDARARPMSAASIPLRALRLRAPTAAPVPFAGAPSACVVARRACTCCPGGNARRAPTMIVRRVTQRIRQCVSHASYLKEARYRRSRTRRASATTATSSVRRLVPRSRWTLLPTRAGQRHGSGRCSRLMASATRAVRAASSSRRVGPALRATSHALAAMGLARSRAQAAA